MLGEKLNYLFSLSLEKKKTIPKSLSYEGVIKEHSAKGYKGRDITEARTASS